MTSEGLSPSSTTGARCRVCGAAHQDLAAVLGSHAPWDWHEAGAAQRDAGELSADVCLLPGVDDTAETLFFLRGHVELPLLEAGTGRDTFAWSVWVSVSGESLSRVFDHWDDPDRAERLPPMFGWLRSDLPYAPTTLGLRAQLHTRAPGLVPLVELEPSSHPLAREQSAGISLHRVAELNAAILGELH